MSEARNRMVSVVVIGSGAYVLEDAYGPSPVLRGLLQWACRRPEAAPVEIVMSCRDPEKRTAVAARAAEAAAEVGAVNRLRIVDLDEAVSLIDGALAVFICVPDPSHEIYLRRAIAAATPAWVVKPALGEWSSATDVIARAKSADAAVWVDYHKRFDPSNAQMKKAVADGRLGAPLHYAVQYTQPRRLPLEAFPWAPQTDVFTYIGCHYADQLDFLFPGVSIERVSAVGMQGEVHAALGGRAYDVVVAQLDCRIPSGRSLIATMQVGWCDPAGTPGKSHQRVEMTFERGRIIADQKARGLQVWDDAATRELNPYFFGGHLDIIDEHLVYGGYGIESITKFLEWCVAPAATRRTWRCSQALPWIERSVFVERVLDLARRSLDGGGAWVAA